MAPQSGMLRSSFVRGHRGTRAALHGTKHGDSTVTVLMDIPRKTHPGLTQAAAHPVAMPSPCWGCRDIQDASVVKKNIQRCEWQWGKINAESNSKDLIHLMAIKPERFSLGKHQPSVISTRDKLPTSHLAKGKEGLLRSPLL